MSEDRPDLKVVGGGDSKPGKTIRIICNEGPPQVSAAALRVDPADSMIAAPGARPPIRIEHATMRPVLLPERAACGRHRFDDHFDKDDDGRGRKEERNCGNCRFGEPTEIELRAEDME